MGRSPVYGVKATEIVGPARAQSLANDLADHGVSCSLYVLGVPDTTVI